PGAKDSATMRPFSCALHRRRRPTPVRMSTRTRRCEESTIWSTIDVNRSRQYGSHPPALGRSGKGGERRLLTVKSQNHHFLRRRVTWQEFADGGAFGLKVASLECAESDNLIREIGRIANSSDRS